VKSVLITGTTRGVGKACQEEFLKLGWQVVSVSREESALLSPIPENLHQIRVDITSLEKVRSLIKDLKTSGKLPKIFILNAGINRSDIPDRLNMENLINVFKVNFFGSLNFIGSLHEAGITDRHIIGITSTAIYYPNKNNMAYFLSKYCLHEYLMACRQKDLENKYTSFVLGPVQTEMLALSDQSSLTTRILSIQRDRSFASMMIPSR